MKELQQKLLNELYEKIEAGKELNEYNQGVFDTLSWIIDGDRPPEIE